MFGRVSIKTLILPSRQENWMSYFNQHDRQVTENPSQLLNKETSSEKQGGHPLFERGAMEL